MGDLLGMFSNALQSFGKAVMAGFNKLQQSVEENGVGGTIAKGMGTVGDFLQKTGADKAALGILKNKLGRPAMYAMDSLLKGDNVGLWHVTIGNPKNPIAVMGNLILTNASIQHSGPLGLDDFPTEIKVTCTLKHARSRDAVEIGRMYTKGTNGIYHVTLGKNIAQWFPGYAISSTKESTDNDEKRLSERDAYNNISNDVVPDNMINTKYAAQIDHYNQNLPYDLSIVLDEIA